MTTDQSGPSVTVETGHDVIVAVRVAVPAAVLEVDAVEAACAAVHGALSDGVGRLPNMIPGPYAYLGGDSAGEVVQVAVVDVLPAVSS